jgi:hypothetical protein
VTKTEARTLRALTDILRDAAATPSIVLKVVVALEAFVADRATRPRDDDGQLELALDESRDELGTSPVSPRTTHQGLASVPGQLGDVPEVPATTHQGVTASPSSSSLKDLNDQQKKKGRVRPFTDDPLPDDCREVYREVVEERAVALPSAEYLWGKFVEYLWAEDKTYARWFSVKRRWRDWCEHEKPIELAPPAPASSPQPKTTSPKVVVAKAPPADEKPLRDSIEDLDAISAAISVGDLQTAARLSKAAAARAPPEPRSMSA